MHGYESVVGPVRGIYNSSNIHKAARGHSLLIENRPHFISILVLGKCRLFLAFYPFKNICYFSKIILIQYAMQLQDYPMEWEHVVIFAPCSKIHSI